MKNDRNSNSVNILYIIFQIIYNNIQTTNRSEKKTNASYLKY